MFIDWLTIHQDFDNPIRLIGNRASIVIDTVTGEHLNMTQPTYKYEGSHSTSIRVIISGNRITVKGNPSRINRLDNLFGFTSISQCVAVYNKILLSLELPTFTKCTKVFQRNDTQQKEGSRVCTYSDGATLTELHITTNKATGEGNTDDYIKGISTLRYRHMIPRLHTNGKTCDFLNPKGKASTLIYPSVYNKANDIQIHTLQKIKRLHGEESEEYKYVINLMKYCEEEGVARFEQKLKSAFLRKHNFRFYGLFDETLLRPIHEEFINIDEKLQVTAMTLENISERLIRLEICKNTRSANTTAMYALQWMSGMSFDLSKKQVQTHRARLRKIGIDIADTCDLSRHSPVFVRKAKEIKVKPLLIPSWYKHPSVNHLSQVA